MISIPEQSTGPGPLTPPVRIPRRAEAQRCPALAHLGIEELRGYREELVIEEIRVAYWQRILQARLDKVIGDDDRAGLSRLGSVLAGHAADSHRLAQHSGHAAHPAVELPTLSALWELPAADSGDRETVTASLTAAGDELSTYRGGLRLRLDTATSELIARYRDAPELALVALPTARPGAA